MRFIHCFGRFSCNRFISLSISFANCPANSLLRFFKRRSYSKYPDFCGFNNKKSTKMAESKVNLDDFDKKCFEDVAFMTAMGMVLMGNYSQTGHFGGPLSYTPANIAIHLGSRKNGGLSYDIRNPKNPFTDKFLLTGGHCIPTCYSLWTILYEAMERQFKATGDEKYKVDPKVAILSTDCVGFRRSQEAVDSLLEKYNLQDEECFAQAKVRGIRALMGHSETTDVTNDINGGPSGIGAVTSSGKALFWNVVGASKALKVIAFEGEFAFTEGHAQELKTIAAAQGLGKRLRFFFSFNNAGIDDKLVGGVIPEKLAKYYDIKTQFSSFGWNVFELKDGNNVEEVLKVFKQMEEWPEDDLRPMVVIAHTTKGWWPSATEDKICDSDYLKGYPTHPYAFPMNGAYFLSLAESFEKAFNVKFEGIRDGPPKTERDRLLQFKKNFDIFLSVLDAKDGFYRKWISNRLVEIASDFNERCESIPKSLSVDVNKNPFKDERLQVKNLPKEPVDITLKHPTSQDEIKSKVSLFLPSGVKKGTRAALSEIGKWMNYVTDNRFFTISADLSGSLNLEGCNLTGHHNPESNPRGTRLKAGIQECGNASLIAGLTSQTLSSDPKEHVGLWGATGTYGAFTPLFYTPLRIYSQQNQDSPFELGVVTVVAGHSGPETAADARSHFGIFAPQVWTLFPEGQILNLYFWDYNDVASGYFAAVEVALKKKDAKIIVIHCARPHFPVADRSNFADKDICAAAKGCYVIREYDEKNEKGGTVLVQGVSSSVNLVNAIPELEAEGINVRIVSVVSEDLFALQPEDYRLKVMPPSANLDCMFVTTMTKRIPPLSNLGPLTKEYSMSADFDNKWRTGGTEEDVIAQAKLDKKSIIEGVKRFAKDRKNRLARQKAMFEGL